MPCWLNKLCVALVTLALLTAPCLSVLGFVPGSSAHAHLLVQSEEGDAAASALQAPPRHVHVLDAAGQSGTSPAESESECCGLCVGWLTGSHKAKALATGPSRSTPDWFGEKWTQAILSRGPQISSDPPTFLERVTLEDSESVFPPLYVRTQRLRL